MNQKAAQNNRRQAHVRGVLGGENTSGDLWRHIISAVYGVTLALFGKNLGRNESGDAATLNIKVVLVVGLGK